ncbi:unnamed protein product [Chondrus crispus]|uniref:Deacetylase sirtuin-type domain-containing protein n=1 Tax=Chondrus crispus TaxID=2769 RepID=R7QS43_CHOCR|nr:unnamed protein product [Chondrus crispus]CDF40336.1 unnamed protein product [Chondrus crispus]|eukprot:XP_005710630.1 unnamed protein product [Chondrus crispus]
MATPFFAALADSPGLGTDLRTVARLWQAILTIDDDDLEDLVCSGPRPPSIAHASFHFIAELEARRKLLRNYSQNIDGLERRAGASEERVILFHGSFLTATCMRASCRASFCGSEIAVEVAAGTVPFCWKCVHGKKRSVLKPDIVFFGENVPKNVRDNLETDALRADLLLVLRTSLEVSPVARIPQYFQYQVSRILVNREIVTYDFDVELFDTCDSVVAELRKALNLRLASSKPLNAGIDSSRSLFSVALRFFSILIASAMSALRACIRNLRF